MLFNLSMLGSSTCIVHTMPYCLFPLRSKGLITDRGRPFCFVCLCVCLSICPELIGRTAGRIFMVNSSLGR